MKQRGKGKGKMMGREKKGHENVSEGGKRDRKNNIK